MSQMLRKVAVVTMVAVVLIASRAEASDVTVERWQKLDSDMAAAMVAGAMFLLADTGMRCPVAVSPKMLKATMEALIQEGQIEKQTSFGVAVIQAAEYMRCAYPERKSS